MDWPSRLPADRADGRAVSVAVVRLTFPRFPAEHVVDSADDDARLFARERVVDRLAVATRRHQAIGPQTRELLRHSRLTQAEQILKLADRLFSLCQYAENHQPT